MVVAAIIIIILIDFKSLSFQKDIIVQPGEENSVVFLHDAINSWFILLSNNF